MTPKATRTKQAAAAAAIAATLLFATPSHKEVEYTHVESIVETKKTARKHYKVFHEKYKSTIYKVFKTPVAEAAVGPYPQFFFPGG